MVVVTGVHTSDTDKKERCQMMQNAEIENVSSIISCQRNISMLAEARMTLFDQKKTYKDACEIR